MGQALEMMKLVNQGKVYKCPKCRKGNWKATHNNRIYFCDNCGMNIIPRPNISLVMSK